MRTIKKSEFECFCREIKKILPLIGFSHYNIIYNFEFLPNTLAQVKYDLEAKTALFYLTTKIEDDEIAPVFDAISLARHESAHLLLAHLYDLSKKRYVTEHDLDEAEEDLVKKIENLLNLYKK